jgi:hypothetical protein
LIRLILITAIAAGAAFLVVRLLSRRQSGGAQTDQTEGKQSEHRQRFGLLPILLVGDDLCGAGGLCAATLWHQRDGTVAEIAGVWAVDPGLFAFLNFGIVCMYGGVSERDALEPTGPRLEAENRK